jgi:regulator of protease activity HflC (stomatin/prohibitin superfamily)
MEPAIVAAIALGVVGYMAGSVKIINEGEAAIVERLGRYHRDMGPGLNFVVPVLDTVLVETTREQMLDVKPQKAMTQDRANVTVDALVFWQILDLYKAYYNVEAVEKALDQLVVTTLLSEVGQLTLEELVSSRNKINQNLEVSLGKETQDWGVKIVRVTIQDIHLSEDLMKARDAELAAESRRKAALSESQAAVESIEIISKALQTSVNPQATLQYLLSKSYIEAQQKLSESDNTKIIFMDPKALNEATAELMVPEGDSNISLGDGSSKS